MKPCKVVRMFSRKSADEEQALNRGLLTLELFKKPLRERLVYLDEFDRSLGNLALDLVFFNAKSGAVIPVEQRRVMLDSGAGIAHLSDRHGRGTYSIPHSGVHAVGRKPVACENFLKVSGKLLVRPRWPERLRRDSVETALVP